MSKAVAWPVEQENEVSQLKPSEAAQLCKLLEASFAKTSLEGPSVSLLAGVPRRYWEPSLLRPLRDFLQRPGKAFRAQITRLAWRAANPHGAIPETLPLIVEILHAGSLIVDDIEDGAIARRGKPALHQIHGTPIALNAGNWLYFWPANLIDTLPFDDGTLLGLHRLTNQTLLQCHQGQALDLALSIDRMKQMEILQVIEAATRLKTGALIACAAAMGALGGGASRGMVDAMIAFGSDLGVGLQMLDDYSAIVNVQKSEKAREDLENGRPTWTWAWLASGLDVPSFEVYRKSLHQVRCGALDYTTLRASLAEAIEHPAAKAIEVQFECALNHIRPCISDPALLADFETAIRNLEKRYA